MPKINTKKKRPGSPLFYCLSFMCVWIVNYLQRDRRSVCLGVPRLFLLVCVKTRLHLLQPRIVFVLEGGLILANFLLQSLTTLGAQLGAQTDRQCEEAEGKEELHVAGNHG